MPVRASVFAPAIVLFATFPFWLSPAGAQQSNAATATEEAPSSGQIGVTVSGVYSDNIFATRNDKEDDVITIVSPYLQFEDRGDNHRFSFDAGAEVGIYAENDRENYEDYWGGFEASVGVGSAVEFFGGGRYSQLHEDRGSPDDAQGLYPTTYNDTEAFVGIQLRGGAFTARLGGTFERLDYNDVQASAGIVNNDDRDRDLMSLGTRVGYRTSPGLEIFVQGTSDTRRYDQTPDDNLQDRESDGYSAGVGVQFRRGETVEGEVHAGYMGQDYADPTLKDVSTPDAGGIVRWRPSSATVVNGTLDRSVEETTLRDASSYIWTALGAGISHQMQQNLSVSLDGTLGRRDFQGIARKDDIADLGMGVAYYFQPRLFIGLDYRFVNQNSSLSTFDYTDNRIFLHLGAKTADAEQRRGGALPSGADEGSAPQGVYVGIQANHNSLVTELFGPRGSGGTLEADFGDHGFGGGAFLGYGHRFGDWYLGAEVSADDSATEWGHANLGVGGDPDGRVFSVRRGASYGVEGRLGTALYDGSLLYGLAGVVRTEFETDYSDGGASVNQDDALTGMRVGAGAEFPIARGLFGRMEYAYTSYADYDVVVGGVDNFANKESTLRLGMGYRFGGPGKARETAERHDFTGPYAGLSLGFGTLYSDNSGDRVSGGGINRFLSVERSDSGAVGGGLAGVGVTLGPIYVGAEAAGELSNINMTGDRDPTGRTYSVQRKESYGASARIGVVLNETTLIYGRAGPVRSRFVTDYSNTAGGVTNSVSVENWLTGLQYGGGIEMPTSKRGFVRFDYSYTDYDDGYLVDYVSGADTFEQSESAVRLTVGIRY